MTIENEVIRAPSLLREDRARRQRPHGGQVAGTDRGRQLNPRPLRALQQKPAPAGEASGGMNTPPL